MNLDAIRCHAEHDVVRTFDEMQRLWQRHPEREWFADRLSEMLATTPAWTLPGICGACEVPVLFAGETGRRFPAQVGLPPDGPVGTVPPPSYRESFHCPRCGLNSRQRLAADVLRDVLRAPLAGATSRRSIYLHEQLTAMYQWVCSTFAPQHEIVGSEWLGAEVTPGSVDERGIRHEDIHAHSFEDERFDVVLSTDVLEHVWDIDQAMRETCRILRPGGTLIATVPWNYGAPETVQVARLADGQVEYLDRPEIHGNPTDPEQGSLVFYRYGWDLLDRIRAAGFADAAGLAFWSARHGVMGERFQWVVVATRD